MTETNMTELVKLCLHTVLCNKHCLPKWMVGECFVETAYVLWSILRGVADGELTPQHVKWIYRLNTYVQSKMGRVQYSS